MTTAPQACRLLLRLCMLMIVHNLSPLRTLYSGRIRSGDLLVTQCKVYKTRPLSTKVDCDSPNRSRLDCSTVLENSIGLIIRSGYSQQDRTLSAPDHTFSIGVDFNVGSKDIHFHFNCITLFTTPPREV